MYSCNLQEVGELDGVCSFSEMAMPLVARLTEKLGLPGNTPASVSLRGLPPFSVLPQCHVLIPSL
jgi:hypothetical protein